MNHSTRNRKQFTATFLTLAQHDGKLKVLLIDIRDSTGTVVANQQMFSLTKGFIGAKLKRSETVSFTASVGSAHQGVSLSRPTNVKKVHAVIPEKG